MRDDLYSLFQRLILLYREKLDLLRRISCNEIQLRFLLQSEKIPELLDTIDADNDIFLKLGSIEFDIRALISDICKTAGIEKDNYEKFFLARDEEPLPDLRILMNASKSQTADLIRERDGLIKDMEKKQAGLKIDIDALKRIRSLNLDLKD